MERRLYGFDIHIYYFDRLIAFMPCAVASSVNSYKYSFVLVFLFFTSPIAVLYLSCSYYYSLFQWFSDCGSECGVILWYGFQGFNAFGFGVWVQLNFPFPRRISYFNGSTTVCIFWLWLCRFRCRLVTILKSEIERHINALTCVTIIPSPILMAQKRINQPILTANLLNFVWDFDSVSLN